MGENRKLIKNGKKIENIKNGKNRKQKNGKQKSFIKNGKKQKTHKILGKIETFHKKWEKIENFHKKRGEKTSQIGKWCYVSSERAWNLRLGNDGTTENGVRVWRGCSWRKGGGGCSWRKGFA